MIASPSAATRKWACLVAAGPQANRKVSSVTAWREILLALLGRAPARETAGD
jgi:hypothetical protein